jgi:hypothetical protein
MRWIALLALLCVAAPASAAERGLVALVPARTFKGSKDNDQVLTDAFRANLEKEGYKVVDAKETDAALKRLSIDLAKPQFVPQMTALGKELKVRYVIYPRIPGVGIGVNQQDPEEFQATILLNVIDPEKSLIVFLSQLGQVFKHPDKMLERAVMPKEAAETAAQRLLEGFYKKVNQ